MTPSAWFIVIAINGAIVMWGLWKARETHESVDWFLAARSLPWWMVGLSMFATAVDSGDYVAVAGGAYQQGLPYLSAWWLGMTTGWMLMAWVILMPLYRSGMFTNCEYLEARFGPSARLIAVLIQIQSRTNVLANVAFSLFLTFKTLTDWGDQSWWFVIGIAAAAAAYTATGGLRSVAVTDAMQSVVMLVAALVLWWCVWDNVGGAAGFQQKLADHIAADRLDASVARAMTHIGATADAANPPILVAFGWIVVLTAYCVVNQSQAMRMLAARSWWDLRMAAVAAALVTAVVMWFNVTLGTLGRAVFPDLEHPDDIFPQLIEQFLLPLGGMLVGVVVAGLLAGGISTYDSIGSALSSLITRDIYARFLVRDADDRHYLLVSRIITFIVIAMSFVYIPFLESGMVKLYLKLVGVAVVPLLTVFLLGVTTPFARSSGTVGLVVGVACGLTRFIDALPAWWTNTYWGYVWSIAVTGAAMSGVTLIRGPASPKELAGLTWSRRHERIAVMPTAGDSDWLNSSRTKVPEVPEYPFDVPPGGLAWYLRPGVWTVAVVIVVALLNLVVFW